MDEKSTVAVSSSIENLAEQRLIGCQEDSGEVKASLAETAEMKKSYMRSKSKSIDHKTKRKILIKPITRKIKTCRQRQTVSPQRNRIGIIRLHRSSTRRTEIRKSLTESKLKEKETVFRQWKERRVADSYKATNRANDDPSPAPDPNPPAHHPVPTQRRGTVTETIVTGTAAAM